MERRRARACILGIAAAMALAAAGCRPGMPIREAVRPTSPYERYAQSLRDAGLAETALGREWLAAGDRALREAVQVGLPFREAGYLPPDEPAAVAYRLELRRGQRFQAELQLEPADGARVFLDVFESRPEGEPRRVAHADAGASTLEFEPSRDGTYLLRVQPELLRGGRYELVQQASASLLFPVVGADSRAVASHFGAPRDGGAREHHGVDIFAPRGTPVLSATDGLVSSVQTTARGGRVVWVWDPSRGASLYYAHLDEQLVSQGQRVRMGEQIGTVGNTGNARGTAPHLHFGIYARGEGPLDPYPFVHQPRGGPPAVTASRDALGGVRRTAPASLRLRAGSSTDAPILAELPRHTIVRIEGAAADWYRVSLPDGRRGYVTSRGTQPLDSALRSHRPAQPTLVRQRPAPLGTPVDQIEAGAGVPVLGRYDDYLFVRTPDGREGWIQGD